MVDIKIPTLGESVSEGVIARWLKSEGDLVQEDEPLIELETDKAVVEIPSETSGALRILIQEGETVEVGQVIARIDPDAAAIDPDAGRTKDAAGDGASDSATKAPEAAPQADAPQEAAAQPKPPAEPQAPQPAVRSLSPTVRRLVAEHDLDPSQIEGKGKGGRITKVDVLNHLKVQDGKAQTTTPPELPASQPSPAAEVERKPMSQIRQRIARRLVEAQQEAAILTTFNDLDVSAVIALRKKYRDRFEQKHGVRLGFMALFGRAVVQALEDVPELNAQIDGGDIVYHKHVNLGIAVSTERGLMVPVVRKADTLSIAALERAIGELAQRGREGKVTPDELSGGTFSITNGGVFGSLLSTPILNPPQSGILGMHRIEDRPVAVDGQVEIRPMMYLALSYDHRLVDGREAVTFLVRVKECLEDPRRMLLGL